MCLNNCSLYKSSIQFCCRTAVYLNDLLFLYHHSFEEMRVNVNYYSRQCNIFVLCSAKSGPRYASDRLNDRCCFRFCCQFLLLVSITVSLEIRIYVASRCPMKIVLRIMPYGEIINLSSNKTSHKSFSAYHKNKFHFIEYLLCRIVGVRCFENCLLVCILFTSVI